MTFEIFLLSLNQVSNKNKIIDKKMENQTLTIGNINIDLKSYCSQEVRNSFKMPSQEDLENAKNSLQIEEIFKGNKSGAYWEVLRVNEEVIIYTEKDGKHRRQTVSASQLDNIKKQLN